MVAIDKFTPLHKEILTGVLDNSYAILALDGDAEKTLLRAKKVLPISDLASFYGLTEKAVLTEVEEVLSALYQSCSSRHRGMSRELHARVQTSKYMWAKYVCANFSVSTMHSLEKLSKNVWGNRLPDKYREELKTHLSTHPSLFEEDEEMVELFGQIVPNPDLETHLSEDGEELVRVQIGSLKITLSRGSKLSLKEVQASTFSVKGCRVTVGEVSQGVLKDVLIQS